MPKFYKQKNKIKMKKNFYKKRQLGCVGCITAQTPTITGQNEGNQLGN